MSLFYILRTPLRLSLTFDLRIFFIFFLISPQNSALKNGPFYCHCLFKVKEKFLRSTSLTVELLGCLGASYIPPDHVSQCSGCDMAHPQLAHTHFGKKGRGRGERMREGGGITRYEDGGGDWVSCPIFSALFLPLQLIYARMCVHMCSHGLTAHAWQACDQQPWPPF